MPRKFFDERSEKGSEKSSEKILSLLKSDSGLAAGDVAKMIGITQRAVEKQIAKLREEGRIRRIGPDKGGYWEVVQ
ncbi:MAG: winged helix-turn-helix transcriptional regulator [Methanothrix sp.]|nr:MAG: winged helix-turn-helix transcriptional regulator [Methanothrix sp.]